MDNQRIKQEIKILLVCPNLKFGGAEKNTVNLANEFHRKGIHVSIVLLKEEGTLLQNVNPDIKILALNKSRSRYAFFAFTRLLSGTERKVVISMLRESSLMASLSILFMKSKPFLIIREACHYESKSIIYKRIISFLYSKADLFISNSASTLKSFFDQGVISKDFTKVIYNPALSRNFYSDLNKNIKHKWLDDPKIITVVTGGRLEKEKNIDQVIIAFETLSKKNKNFRLLVLGDGKQKNYLQNLIINLNLENVVDMLGFVDLPALYIKKAELFVMPSHNEAFGNMLVEAMACGTKVLARKSGGPIEILKNGKIGFLKDFNTSEQLAFEMEQAINSSADQSLLIKRSKDFSVSTIIKEYLDILQTI